jgi:hypothetical protein
MSGSAPRGAALFLVGHVVDAPAQHAALVQALGRIGEALLAADPAWHVLRFAPDGWPERSDLERALASLVALPVEVALVVVMGRVIDRHGEPAIELGPDPDRPGTLRRLGLAAIGSKLRTAAIPRIVFVLAGWGDHATSPEDPSALEQRWMDALAVLRSADMVVIGGGRRAARVIESLRDAFAGAAVDDGTGTITGRSLRGYLARQVPGIAIRGPEFADTIATSPPLISQWDPRLTRATRATRPAVPAAELASPPDALVGTVLPGRFRIEGLLARGGFGTVYRARQLSVDRDVALKILHGEIDPASPAGRLFVHEIQSVGRIAHPNVVQIYQADVAPDGRLFFAMELLEGRDLEQVIQAEGRLEVGRAIALVGQLLAGLGAAHEAGLIHADIKPANALLVPGRSGERVVLVDFGLSRLRAPDHAARAVGGTPAYMAPERLRNGRVGPRSDLFAAALVLVTLLTGWRRRSRDELIPALDDVADPDLREVLRRALALDPAERFATAADLAGALTHRGPPATAEGGAASPPALRDVLGDQLYGRDREVEAISEHALYRGAVLLVGPERIGKTALLRRGVVHHLATLGAHTVYADCRSGRRATAAAIAHAIDPAAPDLTAAIERWHARTAGKLILLLDHLEALVTGRGQSADDVVGDLLAPARWPADADIAVIIAGRLPSTTRLQVRGREAAVVTLGLLTEHGAREAIVGPLSELRLTVTDDLLSLLLRDLVRAAGPSPAAASTPGVYPPHLQRACSVLHDALRPDEACLTRAHYERSGGAAILDEPRGATRSPRPTRRRLAQGAAVLAIVATGAGLAGQRLLRRPPRVMVGGSGSVLYGLLAPVRAFLEDRSATQIPLESIQDVGSGGAIRSLRSGDVDFAATSARFDQKVPEDLRLAGKLMVEVPVGFDETALFVRRDNPLRRIDVAAIRRHLCCGRGETLPPVTWADLGLSTPPLAERSVGWTMFGRTAPPVPNDATSATVLQADVWLCAPRQLCPSDRATDVSADEVLPRRMVDASVLALSTRSFATDQVVPLVTMDLAQGKRLDGRKVLWLYLAVARDQAIPAHLCRFLDAVLDASMAARLAASGKVHGLPEQPLRRQRAWLGLDDGACDRQPVGARASPHELAGGVLRSPIAAEIEITERWVSDAP